MDKAAERIRGRLCGHTLPRWEELPDFELYMDQVLALVSRYLGEEPGSGEKQLTASMVNNYVKLGVMPAPVKKKYSRLHVAHLLVICVLKPVLSISELKELLSRNGSGQEQGYNRFRERYQEMNETVACAAGERLSACEAPLQELLLCAALRAQAEQTAAREALAMLSGEK